MEIKVHHLSGSRSGETQTFAEGVSIRIGRNPGLDVTFDPYQDRLVSSLHAEITSNGRGWVLRDAGSTNGTFVDGERIAERVLRTNDVIELGKGGPRLRVQFSGAEEAAFPGTILSSSEIPGGAPPVVGGTVMMSLKPAQQPEPGQPLPPAAAYRPIRSKSRNPMRALLVTFGVLLALVLVAFVGAFAIRQRNMRRHTALADVQQKVADTQQKVEQAKAEHAEHSAEVAVTEEKVKKAEATGAASPEELAQLKRELEAAREREQKYQQIEENLTNQLQNTNEQLATATSRKPEIRYKYVPVPQPVAPTSVAAPAPSSAAPAPSSAAPVPSYAAPGPVADATVPRTLRPTAAPAPRVTATPQPPVPSPASSLQASRAQRADVRAPETVAEAVAPVANVPAYPGKVLKRKFAVSSVPSPIPLTGMPSSTARDLAVTLAGALESTGKFVNDARAPLSVAVTVVDFHSDSHVTDPKKASNAVSRVGRLLGKNVPDNPVDTARTASYAAAMSLKVELFDTTGRLVTETHPAAQAAARQTSFAVVGVPFNQVIFSDSALGDVSRKVLADAVEALTPSLLKMEWYASITAQRADAVVMGAGRNAGVEVGDVLEALDNAGRVMARLRVTSVAYDSAEMEVVSGSSKKLGPRVRFVGSERAPTAAADRWFVTQDKTLAFDGPGISYKQLRSVPPGLKARFDYAVGSWARVSEGGTRFWVPMAAGRIATD